MLVTANRWGKVRFTEEGIRVEPLWEISEDGMKLVLNADCVDLNGNEVTAEHLLAAIPPGLEKLEFDAKLMRHALHDAKEKGHGTSVVMASGFLPEPGQDGRLVLEFALGKAAGTLREDGSMDFRERGGLDFVSQGDVLGTLYAPVPGQPGYDILGNTLDPPAPKELKIKTGPGVAQENKADGTTVYTATRVGLAKYQGEVLDVVELLQIQGDIDLHTGNIKVDHGSVHITGDVTSGFKVEAVGDVIIDGLVEEADIVAGGLVIAGGIIMNGKNRIDATGDVSAKFFQNAVVNSGGDVSAGLEFSHCEIFAKGKVSALGGKGIINGGHIISEDNIHAKIIGNEARTKTIVEIRIASSRSDSLLEVRNSLVEQSERLTKAIGTDNLVEALTKEPEENRRILAELAKVKGKVQASIREVDSAIVSERAAAKEALSAKRIKADQKANSGVQVIIGGKELKLLEGVDAPSFRLDQESKRIVSD